MRNKPSYKIIIKAAVFLIAIFLVFPAVKKPEAAAYDVPYNTYIWGPGKKMVKSRAAYVPAEVFPVTSGDGNRVTGAEDLCLYGGKLYTACAAEGQVIETDIKGRILRRFGTDGENNPDGTFAKPSGLAAKDGILYVADKGKDAIILLDINSGKVKSEYGRPDSPLYGIKTPFKPLKIATDGAGNMYVAGEGNTGGVIHMSKEGGFRGYLGANKTPVSLKSVLQNVFFSEKQKEKFLRKTPASPSSLATDDRGLLYTVTPGDTNGSVKRLNTLGVPVCRAGEGRRSKAVSVDKDYNMYSVTEDGKIVIYAPDGSMLFLFGGRNDFDRFGLLVDPVAVKTDEELNLYVLDRGMGLVIIYKPTSFFLTVIKALGLYGNGYYGEAEPIWDGVLKKNAGFILAYKSLARASLKREDYKTAFSQFEMAGDVGGYSEAFWQIRNAWLQKNGMNLIFSVFGVAVVIFAGKFAFKKTKVLSAAAGKIKNIPTVKGLLFAGYYIRHPISAAEEMRYRERIPLSSAILMYVLYTLVGVAGALCKGFVVTGPSDGVNVPAVVFKLLFPLLLGVFCNYFVASVTDGAGKFSHVFKAAVYSMTPYIILYPFYILLSNLVTLNELVILDFITAVMVIWCAMLIFLSVYQVHYYSPKEVVKNIFLTAFCFLMVIVFCVMVYLLFCQQLDFYKSVVWEVFK